MTRATDAVRRGLDVAVASALLCASAPLLALIALVVRATSPGPVVFRQQRVGRDGRFFELLKFRTMVADAPARGGLITSAGDPRVTPIGRRLRRWKLDELPQLVNVVRGEMSLVGPRPEVPCYVARYSDEQRRVLRVRPGITDPASLAFVDEEAVLSRFADRARGYEQYVLPRKLALSLAYLERRTLRSDVGVLARTIVRIFRRPAAPATAFDQETESVSERAHSAGLRQEES